MKIRFASMRPEEYRKYTLWAALVTALAVLAIAIALSARETTPASAVYSDAYGNSSVHYSSNGKTSQGNESGDAANSRNFKNSDPYYTIRAFDNMVAIFEGDGTVPIYAIDTPLDRLPETDLELLLVGIRTDTLAEAYKLIEDYE
ncbi:MAG: hypothetical protein PUJ35_06895 [Ruminococcus bromii]|nr:hypothetical protein [Ruminococcus bromii]